MIRTGLDMDIPEDIYGRVAPRSRMALSKEMSVDAVVVDPNYRGEICVLIFNLGQDDGYVWSWR